jgi:hypothetical protein
MAAFAHANYASYMQCDQMGTGAQCQKTWHWLAMLPAWAHGPIVGRGTDSGMPLNWTSPLSNRQWWWSFFLQC